MFRRTMPLSPSGAFLRWLWWQVIVPLAGPILLAVIVAYTWMSIEPSFQLDWSILIDITPWAVTFFCIGLVGSTMDLLWDLLTKTPAAGTDAAKWSRVIYLFVGLGFSAFTVAGYNALMIIARHKPGYVAPTVTWMVTGVLAVMSIALSYNGQKAAKAGI